MCSSEQNSCQRHKVSCHWLQYIITVGMNPTSTHDQSMYNISLWTLQVIVASFWGILCLQFLSDQNWRWENSGNEARWLGNGTVISCEWKEQLYRWVALPCVPFNNSFLLGGKADPLPVAAVPAAVLFSDTPIGEEPPWAEEGWALSRLSPFFVSSESVLVPFFYSKSGQCKDQAHYPHSHVHIPR